MSSFGQKDCYPIANLVDPYGNYIPCSAGTFDWTVFTHIDLSIFDGGSVVPVASEQDITDAFLALGISVVIDDCDIIIQQDLPDLCPSPCNTTIDVSALGYVLVNLVTTCAGNIDYNTFDYIDLSEYGGNSKTAVTSDTDIVDALFTLGYVATINGCDIKIVSQTNLNDIPVGSNGTWTLIDTDEGITPCNAGNFDYTAFDAVDLSQIGGGVSQAVTSDSELIFVLGFYGIVAEINGCTITATTNPFDFDIDDMEVCRFPRIQLVDTDEGITPCSGNSYDFTLFQTIDYTPYGGGIEAAVDIATVEQRLQQLTGADVLIDGCDIIIKSCAAIEQNLEVSSDLCFNCSLTSQFTGDNDYFDWTLNLTTVNGGVSSAVPDGTVVGIVVKDSGASAVASANVIVGQDITTGAGVSGASSNWLGLGGFSYYLGNTINGGFTLTGNGNNVTKFWKRAWAKENGTAGPTLGDDYTIEFSIEGFVNCGSNTFDIPKVTEGRSYSLTLKDLDASCSVTEATPGVNGRALVGIYNQTMFDINTLEVLTDITETWGSHIQSASNCEVNPPPADWKQSFPDPNDANLYHIPMSIYANAADEIADLRGFRMRVRNNSELLYDFDANPLTLTCHATSELPETSAECSLTNFATLGAIQTPVINEVFRHRHLTTYVPNGLSTSCPWIWENVRVYVAETEGVAVDVTTERDFISTMPKDPRQPVPPGTSDSEYTNSSQTVSFAAEGLYKWRAEARKGEDCTDFSGNWSAPGCSSCAGGDADTTNPKVVQEGFYLISSY